MRGPVGYARGFLLLVVLSRWYEAISYGVKMFATRQLMAEIPLC